MDSKNEVTRDKFTYGITAPLSFNSAIDQVIGFEKSFNACIRQTKYQPNNGFELPVDWKEKFESWVTPNVYELLKADYIKSIDEFFDHLKQRLIKNANYLDLSFLEWLKKAFTEASIDKQTNDFRTFVKKALSDGEGKVIENIARINFHLPEADENLNAKTKDNLIQIINQFRAGLATLAPTIALEYADLLTNHVMMSMVGQNPNAFTGFSDSNAGVCPKNSGYDKINLFYSNKNPDRAICFKLVGGRKSEDKEFQQLKDENAQLKVQLANAINTNKQLKTQSTGTTRTTTPTPKTEEKNLDGKRARQKYNGAPCTKCSDSARAATHSTDKHKDNYVDKNAYKKMKLSGSKK